MTLLAKLIEQSPNKDADDLVFYGEGRKARAITFHLMTGHRTEEMTEHYTHLLEEDYTDRYVPFGNSLGSTYRTLREFSSSVLFRPCRKAAAPPLHSSLSARA
jgi:hypothetical protein